MLKSMPMFRSFDTYCQIALQKVQSDCISTIGMSTSFF